jgi:hypothetical protein
MMLRILSRARAGPYWPLRKGMGILAGVCSLLAPPLAALEQAKKQVFCFLGFPLPSLRVPQLHSWPAFPSQFAGVAFAG